MEGLRPDGNCRTCMVEIKGERVLAPSCCRYPEAGHGGDDRQRAAPSPARRCRSSCCSRTCRRRPTRSTPSSITGRRSCRSASRASRARQQPAAGPVASGDGREPRRLHPVRPLRARLPRRAGERRHRLRLPRRALEDRVRPRRPDGRLHVRRLRRVRAGVPDRRADARARGRQGRARQAGGLGLPVLRRRLPAHLQHQGQHDPLRAGQGRPGELQPPVRQGPLRLRLRAAPASADEAADPQARRAEAQGLHGRSGEVARRLPRGDVGRGAGRRGQGAARSPRHLRQARARRLRLGQGHQRRGLSLPEAGAHGLRLEQRRSLHAPVPRLERRGADGGHQLRRRLEPGARRRERRGDLRDRRQPDGQSPGGGHVHEERRQGRREADRRRSAPQRSGPSRHLQPAVQRRHRRGAAQRACCTSSSRRGWSTRRSSPIARPATRRSPRT